VTCSFDWPDATPPADLALHIGELGRSEVSAPFHEPCNLAHQVNDCFIVVTRLNPFAKA
jgi:hypothetical protein